MKLYIEVKASDKLPDKDGDYFTDLGELMYDAKRRRWFDLSDSYPVKWWLESIGAESIIKIINPCKPTN